MHREAEREEAGKVSISSSSWVQVGGGGDKEGVQRVRVVQEVNGNQPVDREEEEEEEEEKKEEVEEPVKPPRLKKLARQQSKQELLRAKGFGQVIHPIPSIHLESTGPNLFQHHHHQRYDHPWQ